MARINVEQKALTDSRFAQLGMALFGDKIPPPVAAIAGLGIMIHVWNECQEQEAYSLHGMALAAIGYRFGLDSDLGSMIVLCDLGTRLKRERIRIKGTLGRIEWLQKRRADGKTGGRPRKTLGLDKKHPGNNPPAPTPAPTLKKEQILLSNPPLGDVDARTSVKPRNGKHPDPELVRLFGLFYEDYPRHEGKQSALKAWLKLAPDKTTMKAIAQDLGSRLDTGRWLPDDPEACKFIPLPASYLNGRRWEDGYFS